MQTLERAPTGTGMATHPTQILLLKLRVTALKSGAVKRLIPGLLVLTIALSALKSSRMQATQVTFGSLPAFNCRS